MDRLHDLEVSFGPDVLSQPCMLLAGDSILLRKALCKHSATCRGDIILLSTFVSVF